MHPQEIRCRQCPHHEAPHTPVLGTCTPPASMCCHGGPQSCLENPCQGGCGLPRSARSASRDATAHVGRHKSAAIAFGFWSENISSKRTGLDSPGEESTDCSSVGQSTVHFWKTASDTQANPKALQMQGRKYTAENSVAVFKVNALLNTLDWIWGILELPTRASAHGGLKQQLEG